MEHFLNVMKCRYDKANFEKAKGSYVYDKNGDIYLDCATAYAVLSLGHCNPIAIKALKNQAEKLWIMSNSYICDKREELSALLCKNSFADKVYFMSTGAEANELGFKTIRRYFWSIGEDHKDEIITMTNSFHGRTIGCISSHDYPASIEGFSPLLSGFKMAEFNNLKSVEKAINNKTAAILLEPIQGEGGVTEATVEFMQGLRKLCDKHGLLLMLDEVQTGASRTGKFYAYQHYGIEPDILSSAKGLGSGIPISACLMNKKVSKCMLKSGSHGTTYGGNTLCAAVSLAVVKEISKPKFLENVNKMGDFFRLRLNQLKSKYPNHISDVTGKGLMIGLKLSSKIDNEEFMTKLRDNKLLTISARNNVIRYLPPLIIKKKEIEEAIEKTEKTIRQMM